MRCISTALRRVKVCPEENGTLTDEFPRFRIFDIRTAEFVAANSRAQTRPERCTTVHLLEKIMGSSVVLVNLFAFQGKIETYSTAATAMHECFIGIKTHTYVFVI